MVKKGNNNPRTPFSVEIRRKDRWKQTNLEKIFPGGE